LSPNKNNSASHKKRSSQRDIKELLTEIATRATGQTDRKAITFCEYVVVKHLLHSNNLGALNAKMFILKSLDIYTLV
jgi:hypothetical protein